MVRSNRADSASYPDLQEYADQIKAYTTRLSIQRRVSVLPLNTATPVEDAEEVDDIVNVAQLEHWVQEDPNAVLSMIANLREDRDEGLDLARGQARQIAQIQSLTETIRGSNKSLEKAKARTDSLEIKNAQLQLRIEELESTSEGDQPPAADAALNSRQSTPAADSTYDPKWPNAPVLTDGKDPTFDFWSMSVMQKIENTPRLLANHTRQIQYASNRLGGYAAEYALPRLRFGTRNPYNTIDELLISLENVFSDPDRRATAQQKLQDLKQGGREFAPFYSEFMRCMSELDYSPRAEIDALIQRIDLRLRQSWDMLLQQPTEMDQVRQYFQTLDSRMRVTSRYTPKPPMNRPATITPTTTRSTTTITNTNPTGGRISDEQREQLRAANKCFYCKQGGHMANVCPKKIRTSAAINEVGGVEEPKNA